MNTRLLWLVVPLLAVLLLGGADLALAKKPSKPPPPPPPAPDPADVGTIYFQQNSAMYTMDTDGTDKNELTIDRFAGGNGEYRPSQLLHGGERWFLTNRITSPSVVDPNGKIRWEIHAVSEGGASVRLFSQENVDLQYTGSLGWTAQGGVPDLKVSFAARHYVEDTENPTTPPSYVVGEYGIYVATIDPGDLPTAGASLALQWTRLPLAFYLKQGIAFSVEYDWSPDGAAIVYKDKYLPGGGIFLAEDDGGTWTTTQLTTAGGGPRWSNDGTRIAYLYGGDIRTMDDDGSNVLTVVSNPPDTRKTTTHLTGPFVWSPNDTHLLYGCYESYIKTNLPSPLKCIDIFRVELTTGGGTGDVCLTDEIDTYVLSIGWCD